MIKYSCTLFITFLMNTYCLGQNGITLFNNAGIFSMSESVVTHNESFFGTYNPASIVFIKKMAFNVGVSNFYLLENLYSTSVEAAYKIKKNHALGIQLSSEGSKTLNYNSISGAYALQLGEESSIGIKVHAILLTAPEIKSKWYGTFSLGGQTSISPKVNLGFLMFNPVAFFTNEEYSDISHQIKLGLNYNPAKNLDLYTSVFVQGENPIGFSFGVSYLINNKINLFLSIQNDPTSIGFGIGIPLGKNSKFIAGGTQNLELGLSPSCGFSYEK